MRPLSPRKGGHGTSIQFLFKCLFEKEMLCNVTFIIVLNSNLSFSITGLTLWVETTAPIYILTRNMWKLILTQFCVHLGPGIYWAVLPSGPATAGLLLPAYHHHHPLCLWQVSTAVLLPVPAPAVLLPPAYINSPTSLSMTGNYSCPLTCITLSILSVYDRYLQLSFYLSQHLQAVAT
jgi:hypothetical protein